jgi:hypothetical protein
MRTWDRHAGDQALRAAEPAPAPPEALLARPRARPRPLALLLTAAVIAVLGACALYGASQDAQPKGRPCARQTRTPERAPARCSALTRPQAQETRGSRHDIFSR